MHFVRQAGLMRFPTSPHLLLLYANFLMEVRHDGPAARAQLQVCKGPAPNTTEDGQAVLYNRRWLRGQGGGLAARCRRSALFLMEVRHDGPAARAQLQACNGPALGTIQDGRPVSYNRG